MLIIIFSCLRFPFKRMLDWSPTYYLVVYTSGQQFLQTFLVFLPLTAYKKKPAEAGSGSFCYEACPALSRWLNCERFGFHCASRELNVLTTYSYFACRCFCIYEFCLIYSHRLLCCLLSYWPGNRSLCQAHWNVLRHLRVSLRDSGIPALIVLRILIRFGGPGGNRTHVHNAFTTKELQQFFTC